MTVRYHPNISSGVLNGFAPLLFKWKGSVYKLVYRELLVFIVAYIVIRILYRYALNADQRTTFELLSMFCEEFIEFIPLSFLLGFYISLVVQSWWTQFINIPSPDRLLNAMIIYIEGTDDRTHLIRRNLIRYWNLMFLLYMQFISSAVKRRFPTLQHFVKAGYMTVEELEIYKSVHISVHKYWMPMVWFIDLLTKARTEERIKSDIAMKHIVEEFNDMRSKLALLWRHDWVPLPLVYTQVVTWSVYLFFIICLIGRQYLDPAKKYKNHEIDLYVPVFTIIQFVFYMGWLKVAESLFNPFGNDDDDLEINFIIDKQLIVAYLWLDDLQKRCPTSLSPYHLGTRDSSEMSSPTSNQKGHEEDQEQQSASKKWRSLFRKSDRESKIPRMVGKRDVLMTNDSLARINNGTWNFSAGEVRQRSSRLLKSGYLARP